MSELEARTHATCGRCTRTYPRTLLFWDGWEFSATCTCGGLIRRTAGPSVPTPTVLSTDTDTTRGAHDGQ